MCFILLLLFLSEILGVISFVASIALHLALHFCCFVVPKLGIVLLYCMESFFFLCDPRAISSFDIVFVFFFLKKMFADACRSL